MAYTVQEFKDGMLLEAKHLNHIEQGLLNISKQFEKMQDKVNKFSTRVSDVILVANKWVGENTLYSQTVDISGITENSQVNLTPSVQQLAIFHEKDLAFVTENDNGVVTVYCIGQKPVNDYIIQATIIEVSHE